MIDGVALEALNQWMRGDTRWVAATPNASLTGTVNPVPVMLTIGGDSGMPRSRLIKLFCRSYLITASGRFSPTG